MTKKLDMPLHEQIKQARIAKRMSKRAAAKACKVSLNAYNAWERPPESASGSSVPRKENLKLLEEVLGVKLSVTGYPLVGADISLPGVPKEKAERLLKILSLPETIQIAVFMIVDEYSATVNRLESRCMEAERRTAAATDTTHKAAGAVKAPTTPYLVVQNPPSNDSGNGQ